MPFSTNSGSSSGGSGAATSIGGQTIVDIDYTTTTGSIYQYCTPNATTDTFTRVAHGLANNDLVNLGGTMPAGMVNSTFYYVVNKTDDTFQLSLTSGGAAVNFTTDNVTTYICCTANPATDTFTVKNHGLVTNDRVCFYTPLTFPTGLAGTFTYWVINATAHTFQVSTFKGGAAVNFTTAGTGLIVNRCELLWSYVLPLQSDLVASWNILAKYPVSSNKRGNFIQNTLWLRASGNISHPPSVLSSQTIQRWGDTDFAIIPGIDYDTQSAQIFAYGIFGGSIRWKGYVQYDILTG